MRSRASHLYQIVVIPDARTARGQVLDRGFADNQTHNTRDWNSCRQHRQQADIDPLEDLQAVWSVEDERYPECLR